MQQTNLLNTNEVLVLENSDASLEVNMKKTNGVFAKDNLMKIKPFC